jgi:hypothetical protein
MKHLAAIALIAVTTLFAASSPSGASNSSSRVVLSPTGTWAFRGLSPAERANVAADIAQAASAARPVLDLLDGSVAIDSYASKCAVGDACSHPEPSAGRGWTIHLPHGTLAGSFPSQRFIVLHEIGHAVWALVFRQADRDAFVAAAQKAFPGGHCVATNGAACAPLYEMFADEFARWAGDFQACMDTYATPPLLTGDAFGAIVDRALAGRA